MQDAIKQGKKTSYNSWTRQLNRRKTILTAGKKLEMYLLPLYAKIIAKIYLYQHGKIMLYFDICIHIFVTFSPILPSFPSMPTGICSLLVASFHFCAICFSIIPFALKLPLIPYSSILNFTNYIRTDAHVCETIKFKTYSSIVCLSGSFPLTFATTSGT